MKKILHITLTVLAVLLARPFAGAQVVDIGLAAGYSMNNEALRLKGSSTTTWLGVNHGFYAGPQFDFNLGKDFSLRTGLYFRQSGSNFFMDLEKIMVNLSQVSKDVEMGSKELFNYLTENPDMEISSGVTAQDILDGMTDYHDYLDKALETMRGTDISARVSRYNLVLPVLFRYTTGRLSVSAGVNLNLMLGCNVKVLANMPKGIVYSDKDLESYFPYAHMLLTEIPPSSENPKMSAKKFYALDIAHEFTVGLQIGIDYYITDWMSLQLSYLHGLRSDVKEPWTDLCTVGDRAFQAGLVYHFKYKKKK